MADNATHYEVVEIATGTVFPVTEMAFGQEVVDATTSLGVISFTNIGGQGLLENSLYAIREVAPTEAPVSPEMPLGVPVAEETVVPTI